MLLSLLLIAVILYVLQRYSMHKAIQHLTYRCELDRRCAESKEVFAVKSVLRNNGWFPLLYLHLREEMPRETVFECEGQEGNRRTGMHMADTVAEEVLYVLGRQQVIRTLHISLAKRGRYLFGFSRITSGDFFGLDSHTVSFKSPQEVLIYPPRIDLSEWMPEVDDYLGEISVQRFILPDPIETIGFREYTGREPMKQISWTKSLSAGQMIVRQFDHFSDLKACLLVNIEAGLPEEIEYIYSAARTLAEQLEKKHIPYSFYSNAFVVTSAVLSSHVESGNGDMHLQRVMELLARATYEKTMRLERLLAQAAGSRDIQKAYLLMSASSVRKEVIQRFEQRYGIKILVLNGKESHEHTETD